MPRNITANTSSGTASLVSLNQGTSIVATSVTRLSGTNTYEFTNFRGADTFSNGAVTVQLANTWADSAGNAAAATPAVNLTVEGTQSAIVSPNASAVIGHNELANLMVRVEFTPAGNKNAALPILAGCLLSAEPVRLTNIPDIRDVRTMADLIAALSDAPDDDALRGRWLRALGFLGDRARDRGDFETGRSAYR